MLGVFGRMNARFIQSVFFSLFLGSGAFVFAIGLFFVWVVEKDALMRVWLSSMIVAAFSLLIMSAVRIRSDTKDG